MSSKVAMVCVGLIFLFLSVSYASVEIFSYTVPSPQLKTTPDGIYFSIEGFGTSTSPYYPVLPTKKVLFEIPYGATDVQVRVTTGDETSLGSFENYLFRNPPMLLGDPTYTPPPPPEQLPDLIPSSPYRYMGTRIFRGHHLVEIVVSPLQYHTHTKEVTFVSSYTVEVNYLLPIDIKESERLAMKARSPAFEPLASQIIENYKEKQIDLELGQEEGPLYDLQNPQYAIITSSTFLALAESLAFWKTRKGVPTKVYNISWIQSNFPGYDTQEKIRNFLRLNDSTPRFDYLLLLGDTNTIPDRKCWSQDGDQVPCDYYYSDVVDGAYGSGYDWDTDNDRVWGEFSDVITWLPDIYVGRIASRSTSEVQTIINNIISYEKNPPVGSWPKKVVFGSAFANYPTRSYGATDMAAVPEHVRVDFLNGAGVTYDRLYEAAGIYPTSYAYDYPLTASNFQSRVALGCGFAFPSGHGNYLGNYRLVWSSDKNRNGYYDDGEGAWYPLATQSYNPSTGGMKPYVLVGACLAGEFDRTEPCYGDFVIANYGIGAVASSRTSYYCVGWDDPDWPWNQGQEYRWWEEIFANGKYRLGQIHGDNKYHYVVDFNTLWGGAYGPDNDYASRKNMFSSNLFGDPELPVWTDTPAGLSVTHNSSIPVGSSAFQVSVTAGGSPLPGATVCLWKGEEVYLVSQTNQNGIATFSVSPSTPGVMLVTVTKHNYIPYEGSVIVEEADNQPPSVTVLIPNGGEVWDIGSTYEIRWIATDNVAVTAIDILLSRDGGVTFDDTLAIGIPNDGSFMWEATYPATLNGRVKVVAYDAANNSSYDTSDADFEIYDPISGISNPLEIPKEFFVSLSPNPASGSLLIRFGLPSEENVRINLYDVSGRQVAEIVSGLCAPGYHQAEFTAMGELSGIYFVRVEAGDKRIVEKVVILR